MGRKIIGVERLSGEIRDRVRRKRESEEKRWERWGLGKNRVGERKRDGEMEKKGIGKGGGRFADCNLWLHIASNFRRKLQFCVEYSTQNVNICQLFRTHLGASWHVLRRIFDTTWQFASKIRRKL